MSNFKDLMGNIRKRLGITALEMALSIGMKPSQLSVIENKLKIPNDFIDRVVAIYDLQPEEIQSLAEAFENIKKEKNAGKMQEKQIKELQFACIKALHNLLNVFFQGKMEDAKKMYHQILQILMQIQEYVFADEKDKQINDNRQSMFKFE